MSTTMIATRTPSFSPALNVPPPPPVDVSPLVVRSPHKNTMNRRRVRFYPEAFVTYTLHHNDYTAPEKRATWLTFDELRYMKKSCQRLALELSETDPTSESQTEAGNDDRCLRGLEGRTRQGLSKRKRVKSAAKNAVLWEQGLRRKWGVSVDGYNDDTALADVYYEYTECAQIEAHMVGLRDATEAAKLSEIPDRATATTTPPTTDTDKTTDMDTVTDTDTTMTTATNTTTAITTAIATATGCAPTSSDDDSIATINATIGEACNSPKISKLCPDPPVRNSSWTYSSGSSRPRNLHTLSHLTSTRRLLTDAFFQV